MIDPSARCSGALLCALVLISPCGSAEARHELWPELDVWYSISERTRALLTLAATRSRESGDRASNELGLYVDHRGSDRFSYRAGYLVALDIERETGERTDEHRLVLDFSYHRRLGELTQLVDRTRLDLRDVAGSRSARLRNRLRLEREMRVRPLPLTSYASLEAYYDSRFDTLSRWRLEAGLTLPSSRQIEWDCYLGWQHDSRPQSASTLGLGLTLNVKF